MKKYYIVFQFCLALVVFSLIGENVIPTKVDVEYLEVIQVLGFDEMNDKVRVTALLKEASQSGESSQSGSSGTSQSGKTLTVESTTYSEAIDILRNITEKYIPISHVEYFIIGEETAKNSLRNVIDFVSRTDETRVTSEILISEDMSAEEFLGKVNENGIDIVSNIEGATKDTVAKNYTTTKSVIDMVDMFLQDEIVGVVPYVSIMDEENFKLAGGSEEQKNSTVFGLDSLGIISDMKIVDEISLKEVEGYNIVKNEVITMVLKVKLNDQNTYVLTCNTEDFKIAFDVENNSIQNVRLNLVYICDIDEVHSENSIFNLNTFNEIQSDCEKQIKKQVEDILNKSKELNLDFMDLNKAFEWQHPYVYRRIKDEFLEQLKGADIQITVSCKINNTYDVLQSNKFQKEE